MILYYIRHGDPIYNPDSLTELGHKQAEALSKRLIKYGIDEIYVSSSNRAKLTAEPLAKKLKITPKILDWANEGYFFGDLSQPVEGGLQWFFRLDEYIDLFNSKEIYELDEKWYEHPKFKNTKAKERFQITDNEVDKLFESFGFIHDREHKCYHPIRRNEKRIALFAHEGAGKAIMSSILDIPYPVFSTRFELGHSSMSVIYFDENKENIIPRVLTWSSDSHLYKEDILTGYQNWLDI